MTALQVSQRRPALTAPDPVDPWGAVGGRPVQQATSAADWEAVGGKPVKPGRSRKDDWASVGGPSRGPSRAISSRLACKGLRLARSIEGKAFYSGHAGDRGALVTAHDPRPR